MAPKFEVVENNRITKSHLKGLTTLENLLFPSHYAANLELVERWHRTNPDVFGILLADGKVVGYYDLLPISEFNFRGLLSGTKTDVDILDAGPIQYKQAGIYHAYLSAIAVSKDYQNGSAIALLRRSLIDKISNLKSGGYLITQIAGEAVSPDGEKFAKNMNAEKVKVSGDGNPIYIFNVKV
jgi:hypothetical protein